MKHIRHYIKEHGIICWLFIRQQVKRQYGNSARILYRNQHLSYYQFEDAMLQWYTYS